MHRWQDKLQHQHQHQRYKVKRNWKTSGQTLTVDRNTSNVIFLTHFAHVFTPHCAQGVSGAYSFHPHAIHDVTCLSGCCLFVFVSLLFISHFYIFSLSLSTCSLFCTTSTMSSPPRVKTTALTHNEEYCTVAMYNPLTGYEPCQLDNFDYSEGSAAIFQDESVDIDTELSYSCDAELDDEIVGKALSSPLFIQERGELADRRHAYHSHEESLLPAQSFFAHSRTGRPAHELSSCPSLFRCPKR